MVARGIKVQEGEKITPANIQRVLDGLSAKPPISKADACGILNIKYNVSRLAKILEEYNTKQENEERIRKSRQRTDLSDADKRGIIEDYLKGISLTTIANSIYRTPYIVKKFLESENLLFKDWEYIPEELICEDYVAGDIVYSVKYNSTAEIQSCFGEDKRFGGMVYSIWLVENQMYAYQPSYELVDLRSIIKKYNIEVKLAALSGIEVRQMIAEGILSARRRSSNDKE
jgi:hypothetical protein